MSLPVGITLSPGFRKNHPPAVATLMLLSGTRWHISLLLALLITLTGVSYYLIVPLSEIAAVIVTTVLCWSSVSLIASHRVSRHYSIYISHGQLMINATFFNMLCAPLAEISHVESGRWAKDALEDAVTIGRGDTANLKLTFHRSVNWLTMMAMIVEPVRDIYLTVEAPELAEARIRKEIEKSTGATILQKAV
ncbi:hypothetical protein [Salinimonas chungwhensis]|uniref:hypothetical protein n=1 Tax=Salinimonas chungwhensis TaxID=265425 RepID=UPI00146158B1|nr:hypothetical protein [Salinimonas chungwhensis]